jgi:hypothetical protein
LHNRRPGDCRKLSLPLAQQAFVAVLEADDGHAVHVSAQCSGSKAARGFATWRGKPGVWRGAAPEEAGRRRAKAAIHLACEMAGPYITVVLLNDALREQLDKLRDEDE